MLSGDVQDVVYYSWQIVESHFVQPKDFSLFSFVLFIKRVNLREFPVLRVFFRVESLVFVWVDVASHVGQPYVITSVCHYIRCKWFFWIKLFEYDWSLNLRRSCSGPRNRNTSEEASKPCWNKATGFLLLNGFTSCLPLGILCKVRIYPSSDTTSWSSKG